MLLIYQLNYLAGVNNREDFHTKYKEKEAIFPGTLALRVDPAIRISGISSPDISELRGTNCLLYPFPENATT